MCGARPLQAKAALPCDIFEGILILIILSTISSRLLFVITISTFFFKNSLVEWENVLDRKYSKIFYVFHFLLAIIVNIGANLNSHG